MLIGTYRHSLDAKKRMRMPSKLKNEIGSNFIVTKGVPLRPLLTKGLHLVGSMLRNRTPAFKAQILSELVERVWPKIEDGSIKPSIFRVLPITQAAEAHAVLERGENVGKVVLTVAYE